MYVYGMCWEKKNKRIEKFICNFWIFILLQRMCYLLKHAGPIVRVMPYTSNSIVTVLWDGRCEWGNG